MLKFLAKILKNKKFNFAIDSDNDGQPFVKGEINLGELLDEALRYKK
jgi:hypothetical protein